MSFRRRIALLAGGAVAAATILASVLGYLLVAQSLRGQVDDSLHDRARAFADLHRGPRGFGGPHPGAGEHGGHGGPRPPRRRGDVDFIEQFIAQDTDEAAFSDGRIGDTRVRLVTAPLPTGGAVRIARSVEETEDLLADVRLVLLLVAIGGIGLGAGLGLFVAGRAVEPLRRLERTAELVAETQDLSQRIDATGADELGRLATRFNAMLDALELSMTAQRQLVADASHELRTPITSLRTNIEILQANPDLPAERRTKLLGRAIAQAEELTVLMGDLIDLARGDEVTEGFEPVRLDELLDEAVARAARHAPDQPFEVRSADDVVVRGAPLRLERAVNNILDNAVKWNRPGMPISVALTPDGVLTVRDHGPGFDPEELDHVFDRFFRGAASRERSGSGLGLAIVRQVVEAHRGSVTAENAPGGGALVRLVLPALQTAGQA